MKEITLKVPAHQLDFVLEFCRQMGLEVSGNYDIPESHKEVVLERIRTAGVEQIEPWEEVKKRLKYKGEG